MASSFLRYAFLAIFGGTLAFTNALPSLNVPEKKTLGCPPFNGTYIIDSFALYPENVDFDPVSCLLYVGSIFNASVLVWDPYTSTPIETLTFPNISGNTSMHMSGVDYDPHSRSMFFVADAAISFLTGGADLTGTGWVIKYDTVARKVDYQVELATWSQGRFSGFQDSAEDTRGNCYPIGSWGPAIGKVSPDGQVSTFYIRDPQNTRTLGYDGIVAYGDTLILVDQMTNTLIKFDTRATTPAPVQIPLSPTGSINGSDAIYLPPKYGGTVLLIAKDTVGIAVVRSQDHWATAEYRGLIPNNSTYAEGAYVTATVEIAGSLYMLEEWFADDGFGRPGNRTQFPLVDITREVAALL